jgi:hypothetical protein
VKYVGWRKNDFHSHIIPPSYGIHFNNFKLKDVCFKKFAAKWGNKFSAIYGKLDKLENVKDTNNDGKVLAVIDGVERNFDYVIDCRGYPEDYTDYNVSTAIPVNHCLVNMVPTPGDWEYTYHVAHRNGWMFGIPLKTRQGWGYLYNDEITTKEDAMADIAERFETTPDKLELREFAFKNYYAKKFVEGRIMKNGNRALFLEPIEAMSGFFYEQVVRQFIDYINGEPAIVVNSKLTESAQMLELFIAYLYHGGSTYDSEFWKITKEKTTKHLMNDPRFPRTIKDLRNMSPSQRSSFQRFYLHWAATSWYDFDKNMGYNYLA